MPHSTSCQFGIGKVPWIQWAKYTTEPATVVLGRMVNLRICLWLTGPSVTVQYHHVFNRTVATGVEAKQELRTQASKNVICEGRVYGSYGR
jgi:hypothetical protein